MNHLAVSREQMRQIDTAAIEHFGIPGMVLMENAGRAVADEVAALLDERVNASVMIVCGAGNNGGDGFVAARHLMNRGYRVTVLLCHEAVILRGDACRNWEIIAAMQCVIRMMHAFSVQERRALIDTADIIVDALFGIGLNAPVTGDLALLIDEINAAEKPVVAVDVPSGLDADTGEVLGTAVRATVTVTMGAVKTGMAVAAAQAYVGRLVVADISIPRELYKR